MTEHRATKPPLSSGRIRTPAGGAKLPDAIYNLRWVAKIRSRCIVDENGCWLWQGHVRANGYGDANYRARNVMVHRKIFELLNGIKLERLEYVCHRCDVKHCCNPQHLWKGNNGLNKKDETSKGKNFWANKMYCPKGHPYTPENTAYHECRPGVISRSCLECARERNRRRYHDNRDLMLQRRRERRQKKSESAS